MLLHTYLNNIYPHGYSNTREVSKGLYKCQVPKVDSIRVFV
jgi:hypothetical protein